MVLPDEPERKEIMARELAGMMPARIRFTEGNGEPMGIANKRLAEMLALPKKLGEMYKEDYALLQRAKQRDAELN